MCSYWLVRLGNIAFYHPAATEAVKLAVRPTHGTCSHCGETAIIKSKMRIHIGQHILARHAASATNLSVSFWAVTIIFNTRQYTHLTLALQALSDGTNLHKPLKWSRTVRTGTTSATLQPVGLRSRTLVQIDRFSADSVHLMPSMFGLIVYGVIYDLAIHLMRFLVRWTKKSKNTNPRTMNTDS